ncbi:MAG: CpaF family protein, partial [Alphaproteobacteria bacterium GM7ARS4]|nr:CpaF family protein [Alphaproteobacteria bacterium GM7ARS4]
MAFGKKRPVAEPQSAPQEQAPPPPQAPQGMPDTGYPSADQQQEAFRDFASYHDANVHDAHGAPGAQSVEGDTSDVHEKRSRDIARIYEGAVDEVTRSARRSVITKEDRDFLYNDVIKQINIEDAREMDRESFHDMISLILNDSITKRSIRLNATEQNQITKELVDDMLGLGPIDELLEDDTINDILINGPSMVYVERRGKLEVIDVQFRDQEHLMNIAQRMASRVGRQVDESSPLTDARLLDGSRVHIAFPPVASNGPYISIRKFAKQRIGLDSMVRNGSISEGMAKVMDIAAACRLNIVVAGGTGAGKTTVLNALSQKIDSKERILTVE